MSFLTCYLSSNKAFDEPKLTCNLQRFSCVDEHCSNTRLYGTHLLIGALVQHGGEIDGSDGRGEVGGDGLYVDVHLSALHPLYDGDPDDADPNHDHHENPERCT